MSRPTFAQIDVSAIRANVAALVALSEGAALCAVVKADGYGHGAVPVARAALDGGATWLAVAFVDEALELRRSGVRAPILLLSEPDPSDMRAARENDLTITVYSPAGVAAANDAALASADRGPWAVHLKVDTGMHRVGVAPGDALVRVEQIAAAPGLRLGGVCSHHAVADEPDDPFTGVQLARFQAVVDELTAAGHDPGLRHVANSASAMVHPSTRLDLVRCGIAIYGIAPSRELDGVVRLRPALSWRSALGHVQQVEAGETVSYGRRWKAATPTRVGTVPVGYADGVRRSLGLDGGEVLIDGHRCPILGMVTMDQLMVDLTGTTATAGAEVVLIGRQGGEEITANDVADLLGTIGYEITCGIGKRVPRRYVDLDHGDLDPEDRAQDEAGQ